MLTKEQVEELGRKRNELRAAKGLAPLADPTLIGAEQDQFTARPPVPRAVAIAALYILKVSYGQLMTLFGVGKSTVYLAIMRLVPAKIRQLRGIGRGRSLISHELASLYFDKIKLAGKHDDPITLAAHIQQLTNDEDPTE